MCHSPAPAGSFVCAGPGYWADRGEAWCAFTAGGGGERHYIAGNRHSWAQSMPRFSSTMKHPFATVDEVREPATTDRCEPGVWS